MRRVPLSIDLEFFDNLVGFASKQREEDLKHFESAVSFIFDALRDRNLLVDVFVTGEVVERYAQLVQNIIADGHRVGFHSKYHSDFSVMCSAEIIDEIRYWSDKCLIDTTFAKMMRVPGFRMPKNNELNVYYDYLLRNGIEERSKLEGISLFGKKIMPGGTVFRLMPSYLFFSVFRRMENLEFYIHPRDVHNKGFISTQGSIKQKFIAGLQSGNLRRKFLKLIDFVAEIENDK